MHYLRETHVCGECRSVKLKSSTDVAGDFEIPNLGKLFQAQIEEDWVNRNYRFCVGLQSQDTNG
jgi:hypothetical protein